MLSSLALSYAYVPLAPLAPAAHRCNPVMETKADLQDLAKQCNPIIGFWDPLSLADYTGSSTVDQEAFIGFLRHSEIKHGRVAMAAFVGFCVQSNGIHFPWDITGAAFGKVFGGETVSFASSAEAGGPAAQWDALPTASKLSFFGGLAFLEMWSEFYLALEASGEKHYMAGGKPGFFPSFKAGKAAGLLPHPVPLDLWDPLGFTKKMTPERKAKALVAEINNGRLAMIGILGFFAAAKGLQVPGLDTVGVTPYAGEVRTRRRPSAQHRRCRPAPHAPAGFAVPCTSTRAFAGDGAVRRGRRRNPARCRDAQIPVALLNATTRTRPTHDAAPPTPSHMCAHALELWR